MEFGLPNRGLTGYSVITIAFNCAPDSRGSGVFTSPLICGAGTEDMVSWSFWHETMVNNRTMNNENITKFFIFFWFFLTFYFFLRDMFFTNIHTILGTGSWWMNLFPLVSSFLGLELYKVITCCLWSIDEMLYATMNFVHIPACLSARQKCGGGRLCLLPCKHAAWDISSTDKENTTSSMYDTCSLPQEIVKKQNRKKTDKVRTKVITRVQTIVT